MQVRADIERANLINREIRTKVNVSPEEVERYYKAHLDEYGTSPKVHARLISLLVPADASDAEKAAIRAKAEEVHKLAADGGNFAKLAKEYSQGPAAEEGGDIGEIEPDRDAARVREGGDGLKPGQVSPLIATADGFHILKIEQQLRRDASAARRRQRGDQGEALQGSDGDAVRPLAEPGSARASPRRDLSLSLPLGITLGDPAGVGAEVILKALAHPRLRRVPAVVIGDVETMRETAKRLRLRCEVVALSEADVAGGRAAAAHARRPPDDRRSSPSSRLGAAARRPGQAVDRGRPRRLSLHRDRDPARAGDRRSRASSPRPSTRPG